jgi:hypothetical protein
MGQSRKRQLKTFKVQKFHLEQEKKMESKQPNKPRVLINDDFMSEFASGEVDIILRCKKSTSS